MNGDIDVLFPLVQLIEGLETSLTSPFRQQLVIDGIPVNGPFIVFQKDVVGW